MASPQKEDGYTPIANELLDQVCKLKLNGTQFSIILVVWRYTYGFSRKQHELSETFISKATGIHKKQISRELNYLIKQNIITVSKEASFTNPRIIKFNKNYNRWLLNSLQATKTLPPNESEDGTGSELVPSPGNENVTQDKQILKQILKQDIYSEIVNLFHEICVSYPRIVKVSENRKKAIKARSNNYSIDEFKKLFIMAEESNFLKGQNERNWSANFDWLLKDSNMAKVLEGNYKNKPKNNNQILKPQQNKFNNHESRNYTPEDFARIEKGLFNKTAPAAYETGVSMDDID